MGGAVSQLKGFWSYVHADDESDDGRIARLAKDVVAESEMLTGEKIDLFLDKDAISWGEDWRNKIDDSLASIAFFIPVITPRYFMSAECRRELRYFASRAKNLGVEELVLPLLYVDVPSLHEDTPSDDLVALVKPFQWENWLELRFADVDSGEYRRGVARLARRLVEANKQAEEVNLVAAARELEPSREDEDDAPGVLDQLAAAEETLPEWQMTLEAISREITEIGQIAQEAAEDIQRGGDQGMGFAARLTNARKLSKRMHEPSERVWSLGNEFASQLHRVDTGFRTMINQAASEVRENLQSRSDICDFFNSIREMSAASDEAMEEIQNMINEISPIEGMSRDLRNPLRRLRQGLTLIIEAREVTDEWVELIEGTGIDCDDLAISSPQQPSDST
jgi:uncharacterized coiled-coil DUF342 family protein